MQKPTGDEYINLIAVYEQMRNVKKKHCEKSLLTAGTFTKRYDKCNDIARFQPWVVLRFTHFIATVVTMVASNFCTYVDFTYRVQL